MNSTTPVLSDSDLRQALAESLRKKFVQVNPLGQPIGERPIVEEVVRDSATDQQAVVYRYNAQYWRAPFVVNHDQTVSIGEGAPVARQWTLLSGLSPTQCDMLEREIRAMFRPLKGSADGGATIAEIRPELAPSAAPQGRVVVGVGGNFELVPYVFDSPAGPCWVTRGMPMSKCGTSFMAPSVPRSGLELDEMSKRIQDGLKAQGISVTYGQAMVTASKVLASPSGTSKLELAKFLSELLASASMTQTPRDAGRGRKA